jgi:uncharacterized cupredoxin-like copper-binding protein
MRTKMKSTLGVVSMCALAIFFRGAEVQAQSHDHETDPVMIEVTMADFSYSPAVLRIPAGRPVMLVFTNMGVVEHEFMAGRTAVSGDFAVDLFENVDVEMGSADVADHDHAEHMHAEGQDDHGTMIVVEPGARGSMTFELSADLRGEWEMACFIPGHYDGGMHGTVVVY